MEAAGWIAMSSFALKDKLHYLKAIHGFTMDSRAFVFAKSLPANSSMIHSQITVASYYHGHFNSKVHKRLSSNVKWH